MINVDSKIIQNQKIDDRYAIYNCDSVEFSFNLPDNSIGYTLTSIPFLDMFIYSDDDSDFSLNQNKEMFFEQIKFLFTEILRATKPGRIVSIEVSNVMTQKGKDGYISQIDLRGKMIELMTEIGFHFISEILCWKDPLLTAVRTKALNLLHKQVCKDTTKSFQAMPNYIINFKKPGENVDLIEHENGIHYYPCDDETQRKLKMFKGVEYSHNQFRQWASPVWMDWRQTRTLNFRESKGDDEKHICPFSLDIVERCLVYWSKKDEIVYDPFAGIGTVPYTALQLGRKAIASELKENYFNTMIKHINKVVVKNEMLDLF